MGKENGVSPQPTMMPSCGPMTMVPVCSPGGTTGLRGPWASKTSLVMGIVQIILGVLLIIAQSIALGKHTVGGITGMGIICGTLFIVTGAFCVAAGKNRNKCLVVTVMVLSILSASFTTFIFITGSVAIAVDKTEYRYRTEHWDYPNRGGCYPDCGGVDYHHGIPSDGNWTEEACPTICVDYAATYYYNKGLYRFMLSLHGMMLCFALIELILAVIVSALTCRAVQCCCDDRRSAQYSYVIPVAVNQPGSSQIPTSMLSSPAALPMNYSGYTPVMRDTTQAEHQEAGAGSRPPSYSSLSVTETKKADPTPSVDII